MCGYTFLPDGIEDALRLLLLAAVYIVATRWVLPKLGVPT